LWKYIEEERSRSRDDYRRRSITTFRTLTKEEVTSISVELANKAYIHLLTALELTTESATEPYTETDPFAYNTATTIAL
jgi:hypothetical protein